MGDMFLRGRGGGGSSSTSSSSSGSSSSSISSSSRLTHISMVCLRHVTRSDSEKPLTSHAAIFCHGILKITFKLSDHVHIAHMVRSA